MKIALRICDDASLVVSPKCLDIIVKALAADGAAYQYTRYEKGADGEYHNIKMIKDLDISEHLILKALDDKTLCALKFLSHVTK